MNQQLLQDVLSSTKLPTPPAIAMRVIELTNDPNVTPKDLTSLVQADSGLSSKILRTVNSAFYGLSAPVASIERAQILLGISAIKTLALGFTLVETIDGAAGESFDYVRFWKRSLHAAACAKAIASRTKCMEPEEALLGGLLQDVGMVVLSRVLGARYHQVLIDAGDRHTELSRLELVELDMTHAVIGASLAERWRFPASLIAPVRYHEQPTAAPKALMLPARCVGLASIGASALTEPDSIPSVRQFLSKAQSWFSLERSEAEDALDEASRGAREFAKLLDIDAGPPSNSQRILEVAKDKLIDLNLDRQIKDAVGSLRRQTTVDALTGASSRSFFIEMLGDAHKRATESEGTLSLVQLDLDGFRKINEEHGREIGDAVLIEVARRLAETFAPLGGEVGRTTGETFGVLLPGVDSATAAKISRRVVETFEQEPVGPFGNGSTPAIALSVRVGVTTLDPDNALSFGAPLTMLAAAERALDAARAAGGRAVRAFVPQARAAA